MTTYALCMGINDYQGAPLYGCVNDARSWTSVLSQRGAEVFPLINHEATRENILLVMRSTIERMKYGDRFVWTFSGHGTRVLDRNGDEKDGFDEALVPFDYQRKGVITDDEMYDVFDARGYGRRIVGIPDACHSGTVMRSLFDPAQETEENGMRRIRFLPPSEFMTSRELEIAQEREALHPPKNLSRRTGVQISACQDFEFAYDAYIDGRPQGAFTSAAIKALDHNPRNYDEWHQFIGEYLPTPTFDQTPQIDGSWHQRKWKVFA